MSVVVIAASGACGDVGTPAPAAPSAAPAQPAPPSRRSLTVVSSAAREDWPCAIDVLTGANSLHETAIAYDGPTACLLPIDAQADGIIGCPTAITLTALQTGNTFDKRLRYDATGHLVERRDPRGTYTYDWDRDQVVSLTYGPAGSTPYTLRYVESESSVILIRDAADGPITYMDLRFADDKLAEFAIPRIRTRATLTWDGPRLHRVDAQYGSQESYWRVMYDCAL